MKILWEEGIGADVSTLGEMMYAKAAGIPPSHWVVHGNNKSDEELQFAAEDDAWLVVMDEPGEVERCVAVRREARAAADHAGHRGRRPREDHDRAPGVEVRRAARRRRRRSSSARVAAGLEMLGLHVHLGSQLMDATRGARARRAARGVLRRRSAGRRRSSTWAAASASATCSTTRCRRAPEEYARERSASLRRGLPKPQLVFEPGRSPGRPRRRHALPGRRRQASAARRPGSRSTAACPTTPARRSTARAIRRSLANRADEPHDRHVRRVRQALRERRRADRAGGAARAEARRPARDPGDGRVRAVDGVNYNAQPRAAAVLVNNEARVVEARELPAEVVGFESG